MPPRRAPTQLQRLQRALRGRLGNRADTYGRVNQLGTARVDLPDRPVFGVFDDTLRDVIAAHRQQVRTALFQNPDVDRSVWDLLPQHGNLLGWIFIEGVISRENEPDIPYRRGLLAISSTGAQGLQQDLHELIDNYSSLRERFEQEGSDTRTRLDLRNVNFTVYGSTAQQGGASARFRAGVLVLSKDLKLIEPPQQMRYADKTQNNCFFRALRLAIGSHFTQLPQQLRAQFCSHHRGPISVEQALTIATGLRIKLFVHLIENFAVVATHTNLIHEPLYEPINIALYQEHYFVLAEQAIEPVNVSSFLCIVCNEHFLLKDYSTHMNEHRVVRRESLLRSPPLLAMMPHANESLWSFGQRYARAYSTEVRRYIHEIQEYPERYGILWLAGPGGCGKTFVLKTLSDLNLVKLAPTGKAANAIDGETIDRFFFDDANRLTEAADRLKRCDALVIEEVSMVTATVFTRLNTHLKLLLESPLEYGGIPIIIMGDFLQLPPISGTDEIDWAFRSPSFQKYVKPIHLGFGFRYMHDAEFGLTFFNFLMCLRKGELNWELFVQLPWKGLISLDAWAVMGDQRPTLLAFQKKSVKRACRLAGDNTALRPLHLPTRVVRAWRGAPSTERMDYSDTSDPLLKIANRVLRSDTYVVHDFAADDIDLTIDTTPEYNNTFTGQCPIFYGSTLHMGQELMVMLNGCARNAQGEPALFNGALVTLEGLEGDKLVVSSKDEVYTIAPCARYSKQGMDKVYLAWGYPIQAGYAFTVHKGQGATIEDLAFLIPLNSRKCVPHLLYVALSRATQASNVTFVVDRIPTFRCTWERFVFQNLVNLKDLAPVSEAALHTMEFAEGLRPSYPRDEISDDYRSTFSILRSLDTDRQQRWKPKVPAALAPCVPGTRSSENLLLFRHTIVFDVETGSAQDNSDISELFADDGSWVAEDTADRTRNQLKLLQTWWLAGAVYYCKGCVAIASQIPELERFAPYQDPKTLAFRFHRGMLNDGSAMETHWCKRIFVEFLLAVCEYRTRTILEQAGVNYTRSVGRIAAIDRQPIYLVGFNIDSFDILGVIQSIITTTDWYDRGYRVEITPNSSSTYIDFALHRAIAECSNFKLLKMHDISRTLGKGGSLKKLWETYVKPVHTVHFDAMLELHDLQTSARTQLREGRALGKSDFPHFKTQREGFRCTLEDRIVHLERHDYTLQSRKAYDTDLDLQFMNLFTTSWTYMCGDLFTTMALYLCVNTITLKNIRLCVLRISTAQQMTTYRYLRSEMDAHQRIRTAVLSSSVRKDGYEQFTTLLPTYSFMENQFLKEAVYGGKVVPRVRWWESSGPDDFYYQGDVSGMYAWCQQECPYPMGHAFYHIDNAEIQHAIQRQYELHRTDTIHIAIPQPRDKFPYPFVARVRIRYPALLTDPGVAFRDPDGTITWGICPASSEDGSRVQVLSNVDLAIAADDGAELLDVFEVMYWTRYEPFLKRYTSMLNNEKYREGASEGEQRFAKLCANANFGAQLKQRKHDIARVLHSLDDDVFVSLKNDMDRNNIYPPQFYQDRNVLVIRGALLEDTTARSDRCTSTGIFVLAWSHWLFQRAVRSAYGPHHIPSPRRTTLSQLRRHLETQILYSDTDSAYFHRTHMERILRDDESRSVDVELEHNPKVLWSTGMGSRYKLGKFADEQAECVENYQDFLENHQYVRVQSFASDAPKSYTAYSTYQREDSPCVPIFKTKTKGIPSGGRAQVCVASVDPERYPVPPPFGNRIPFQMRSPMLHRYMFTAIKSPHLYLDTRTDQTIQRQPITVESSTFALRGDEQFLRPDPCEIMISNLDRKAAKSGQYMTYKKRRPLTDEEAQFLRFDSEEQRRITVPIGWNYDRSLFMYQ